MVMNTVNPDREFALLIGKAFLRELREGNRDQSIAFGRAFLLALGNKGPEAAEGAAELNGRGYSEGYAEVET